MTDLFVGRLKAALSCGVALGALTASAAAQDTTIGGETTAPVATSDVGSVTIAEDGSITLGEGTAVTVDSDDDVTLDGTITLDGEEADAVGILVTGERTGTILGTGTISIASAVESDTDEQPADFPDGRFGLLIAEDARLTGDVTFGAGSSIVVDAEDGAGIGVLGALDGSLSVAADVAVEGDGVAGVRIAGPVTGDVTIASVATGNDPARITARGVGANAVSVEGDVGGRLTVARDLRARVFTNGLEGDGRVAGADEDPDPDTPLTDEQQAALRAGNALRVTGDVTGGIVLTAPAAASGEGDDAVPAQTGAALQAEGASAALYIGEGAVIGVGADDPDTEDDESFGGFGLVNGGVVAGNGVVTGASSRGLLIEDASVAGGLSNLGGALILAEATGADAQAVAVEFGEDASLGTVLNAGTIRATVLSDTGDAVAFVDRSGTVTRFENQGTISATVSNFDDGDPATDEGTPTGTAIAADLTANTSGLTFANAGGISGAVRLGSGADTYLGTGALRGDLVTGDGDDTVTLDGSEGPETSFFGFLTGTLETGDGDDTVTVRDGAYLGGLVADRLRVVNRVSLGEGEDTVTVTGEGSRMISVLDFGGGGGAFSVLDGGRFDGTISNAGDVDVTVGGEGSVRLFSEVTDIASLTTLEGPDEGLADGAVLTFDVAPDGEGVSALNVAGDATIADDTTIRTVFATAFSEDLSAAIVTAGGDLDIDLAIDRLEAEGAAPFLFSQSLSLSDDGQSLLLNLERRSADQLGLNPAIAPAYEPVIAALVAANTAITDDEDNEVAAADTSVGRAVFNLTGFNLGEEDEVTAETRFLQAFDQFLPGPLDAPLTYARTQTNSVTSLVTQRVDALRDGTDGRRNAWLQESSYFVDRGTDGAARGFDGGGFVIALGVDSPVGPIDTVGLSASVASARYDEETGEDFPYDRLTYSVGAYAAEAFGPLRVDGRVAYGWASSESERNLVLQSLDEDGMATGEGDVRRTAQAEWDGTQLSAYGRVLYAGQLGRWDVQPFVSLDYLDLTEDAYEETGDEVRAVALSVDEREATSLRGNVGVVLGREFKTRPSRFDTTIPATIAPRLTLAYSDELDGDDLTGTYNFADGEDFVLAQEKPGGAAIVGGDVVYENEYARLGAGGSVTASEETQIYTLRVGVGLKW